MIISLGKDKTVGVLVDEAGNQAILSLHVYYTAIEEEQSLEQALEGKDCRVFIVYEKRKVLAKWFSIHIRTSQVNLELELGKEATLCLSNSTK